MDFRTFINFILAFEHRDTYASLLVSIFIYIYKYVT